MSAMTEMSRAIRGVLESHAPDLRSLPPDVLTEVTQIVGAFYLDLKGELDRRGGPYDTPESVALKAQGASEAVKALRRLTGEEIDHDAGIDKAWR